MYQSFALLLFLICLGCTANAQEYKHKRYTVDDGRNPNGTKVIIIIPEIE
ncbi:MAG: hypothetical protein MI974_11350 [Chitinophagales bacterium]|nr:hypothetical protein [Chitinophagales bacterium]